MLSIALACLAACCAATANYFFRKNSVDNHSTNAFLLCFYFASFAASCLISPNLFSFSINPLIFGIGSFVGILNVSLMLLTAKALDRGPAGITFAFQNGGAIFPALILFLIFGETFGFAVTPFQLLGMGLVICGLWMGSRPTEETAPVLGKRWFLYALGCFFIQMVILSLFHWRTLLFKDGLPDHLLIPATLNETDDAWFMPGFFITATLLQGIIFLKEKRSLKQKEILFGFSGGIANGISTFFLLLATKIAMPFEKSILFPCFTVGVILLCSAWGYKIYKEKVHFKANALCAGGIILAALA